jgi:geranylgeranylglycerol-phosphate geranylgeranyltransferase
MLKLNGFIAITRPLNCLISFISIFVGGLLADNGFANVSRLLAASIAGSLVCAGANAINDYYDVETDRINKPMRPIPSGTLTRFEALVFSIVLFIMGLAGSLLINVAAFCIASGAIVLLFFYSSTFKGTVLIGNLVVGLVTGFAFVFGATSVGNIGRSVVPALFAFLLVVGREIVKDIDDMDGDSRNHIVTFPTRFGVDRAIMLVTFLFGILIIATVSVYFLKVYNERYLIAVVMGSDSLLLYTIFQMWKHKSRAAWGKMSATLKWNMIAGLLAFYVG